MAGRKLRWLGFGLVACAGAGTLALTSLMHSAFAYGDTADAATDPTTIGLVMGGSGTPIPGPDAVQVVNDLVIHPNFPDTTYPGVLADGLFTPEGLYALYTPVNSLTLDASVAQGVTILDNAIQADIAAKDITTVFGASQSATISSLEMQQLDPSGTPSDLPVQFVLVGDPSFPNGGLLERADGLSVPSLGITFSGATPGDDFPTVIYTQEYDGFADFPQYPINLLADLNAFLGILYVHPYYLSLSPTQLTPVADGGTAIPLPTEGPTETSYLYIQTADLPLLDPVRDIPVIGTPLADLLQPDLTVLVNLGYGNPDYGFSAGPDGLLPANVPTMFGLFPDVNPQTVLQDLVTGAQTGLAAFESAISTEMSEISTGGLSSLLGSSSTTSTTSLSDLLAALSTDLSSPAALSTTLTDVVNAFSGAASSAYGLLLPTADIVNALVTSLPAYDASLFTDNLQSGDLLDAIGLPVAFNTAGYTLAAGVEYLSVEMTVSEIMSDFSALIPS
jgi:hypothetical protein